MNIASRLETWKDRLLPRRACAKGELTTTSAPVTRYRVPLSGDVMERVSPPRAQGGFATLLGRALSTGLCIWLMGMVYVQPVHAATSSTSTVPVDQQPLTLQPSIPPNIVLMLDDSGSMAWDFMPDACYLYGVTCEGSTAGTNPINGNGVDRVDSTNNDAMINNANNGVYYNPKVTYSAPPMANGSYYPDYSDFTNVPVDGFNTSSGAENISTYTNNDVRGEVYSHSVNLNYSTNNQQSVTKSFDKTVYSINSYPADRVCQYYFGQKNGTGAGPVFIGATKDGLGNWASGECKFSYASNVTFNYFQYSTGGAAGPYTVYYVAPAAQGCGTQPNCYLDTDTSGVAAPQGVAVGKNIANWFAYYHTRILMAKSGLMTAFSKLDSKFRVGFGSIDGGQQEVCGSGQSAYYCGNNNYLNLPSNRYSYTDAYNGGGLNYIAKVAPFGDGSSGADQKSAFWTWVSAVTPSGGTPLRQALDAVGTYYKQSQPWQTMSSDPVADPTTNTPELACRQSYTILTTDGFWNGSYSSSTTSKASDTSGPTNSGSNDQSYTYSAVPPYSGGDTSDGSPSLADVAMYYWKNDLRSTSNEVPPSTEDPASWQHMTTFTMGLGFTPNDSSGNAIDMTGVFKWAQGGAKPSGFAGWPQPASNSINNIADLAHAGVNGHGGFYSATSPDSFTSGLQDALKRATERVGTGASLAANSTQLKTGTMAYQANYYTAKWKGDLKASTVDPNTGVITPTAKWTASSMLPAASGRNIQTYDPDATGSPTLVAFKNGTDSSGAAAPPALSSDELTALGSTATDQMNIVNYLRGDGSLEQSHSSGIYRTRDTPLGDIVDSQPVYSGAPDPNEFANQSFTGTDTFNAFAVGSVDATTGVATASKASTRTPLVYVAANDGMLHAFDASTGAETFAYLPAAVILAGVKNLSDPNYGTTTEQPHQYYNDGELTVADAYLPSLTQINGSSWHTILVGTTGRGTAKSVYALDVTDPANIALLWERYATDGKTGSGYIGQMVGKPVIAQTTDGSWSVLIGNGYNSAEGVSALLQFDLATGSLSVHTTGDTSTGNGLAAPVAWMDDASAGVSTEAYAGDLHGNVWSFPLNYLSGKGKNASITACGNLDTNCAGTKIFTATDGTNTQPITGGMLAGKDPATGNVWLFFGTGQYLSSTDLANMQVQTWYGVVAQAGTNASSLPALPATRSDLVQRSIIAEQAGDATTNPPTLPARAVSAAGTNADGTPDLSGKRGWYLDLESPTGASGAMVAQGERMVTPNQFQGNLLLGTTRIPEVTDVCNPSGRGWVMAINPFTGGNPPSNFFDVNGDGSINSSDTITLPGSGPGGSGGKVVAAAGVGFNSLPNNPIFVGGSMLVSFDNGTTASLKTSGSTGAMTRVSWQELISQ
ncbi:PilC/PilY family type IV pilus protein [Rhodanobacter sp. 115]|uniref:pilus assembly protein n=1 Tax=Rhodanobacter sp. FW021-MT20 TaxID=1162282 RepID=UPI001ED9461D|nr:PilC/PilY family type IV pilus protein [Rhodanobacter sp. 115]